MTSNRFPPYYDLCLRCREKGLDQVAEFIHELVNEREQLRDALRWALPYVKNDERVKAIVRAALKEGE
jgi:hypothetical protein